MRLVDADELIDLIERMKSYHQDADDICEMIQNLATIEPMQKRGKWIDTGDMDEWWAEVFTCSECSWSMLGTANFCPNCGADMRGEQK